VKLERLLGAPRAVGAGLEEEEAESRAADGGGG
jgi:hypothetical protein